MSGVVKVVYVKSEDQVADTLTKGLAFEGFSRHRAAMMNIDHRQSYMRRCAQGRRRGG